MTTQAMTERDKKLLYMLGFIVIIFLFVIIADRPLFRKIRATDKEIAKEQETHDTIEMKLNRMEMVDSYKKLIDGKVSLYSKRYYPLMDSTRIDELLTGYVLEEGLKAVNLYIDIPEDTVILPPYKYSSIAQEGDEISLSAEDFDKEQVEAFTAALNGEGSVDVDESASLVADTSLSGVVAANVSMTAFGSEQRLKALLDKMFADQSLRITGYQWLYDPGQGFSYVDGQLVEITDADKQLTITLQMLMYDENAYVEQTLEDTEEESEE